MHFKINTKYLLTKEEPKKNFVQVYDQVLSFPSQLNIEMTTPGQK